MPHCNRCGKLNNGVKFCTACGNPLKESLIVQNSPVYNEPVNEAGAQTENIEILYAGEEGAENAAGKKRKWIIAAAAAVTLIALCCWYFIDWGDKVLYTRFALPNELNLRSSQFDGSDANVIGAVKYGGEIMVLKDEGEWSAVKVNGQKGYMKNKYLADAKDFFEMDAIVRSCGTADTINETRFKKSLLNYFRQNNYSSNIEKAFNDKYFDGRATAGKSIWKIRQTSVNNKTIVRGRFNGIPKKGLACILEREDGSSRKLVVFIYDENEAEIYRGEFTNADLVSLSIARTNAEQWYINGYYTTLAGDAIIADYENGDRAIAVFDGSSIALHIQPVEYGD